MEARRVGDRAIAVVGECHCRALTARVGCMRERRGGEVHHRAVGGPELDHGLRVRRRLLAERPECVGHADLEERPRSDALGDFPCGDVLRDGCALQRVELREPRERGVRERERIVARQRVLERGGKRGVRCAEQASSKGQADEPHYPMLLVESFAPRIRIRK